MPKIQNNFLLGTVNKDLSERLTPNGQLTDAVNFLVSSQDGSKAGVGKNLLGNVFKTNFDIPQQDNPECIGAIADEGRGLIYVFIASDTFDYVIKYNPDTNESIRLLQVVNGGVLNFSKDHRIVHSDLITSVEEDDLLAWTDGFNPPRIINANRIYPANVLEEAISVMKPAPKFAPEVLPTTQLAPNSPNADSNELEDRFVSFAYRWKYKDGYYSSFSPFSEYFFIPRGYAVDFDSMENLGMVNTVNQCKVRFRTGSSEVIGVDVLFKYEGLPNVYVLDKFDKLQEQWGNNQNQEVIFLNNKKYASLPESQWFRSFDNVPLTAFTQEKIGNRLVYGNFKEGRDMLDSNGQPIVTNFEVDFVSATQATSEAIVAIVGNRVDITFPDDFEFTEDKVFRIKLKITTGIGAGLWVYENELVYVIEQDYADFDEFYNLSGFVDAIEQTLTSDFQTDFLANTPYSNPNFVDGFVVTNPEDFMVSIRLPIIDFSLQNLVVFTSDTGTVNTDSFNFNPLNPTVIRYKGKPGPTAISILNIVLNSSSNIGSYTINVYRDRVFQTQLTGNVSDVTETREIISQPMGQNDASIIGDYQFVVNTSVNTQVTLTTSYRPPIIAGTPPFVNGSLLSDDPFTTIDQNNINIPISYDLVEVDLNPSTRASMKSNRSYEVGIIWRDKEGRKTPCFISKDNSIFIPHQNSITQNQLRVKFPQNFTHPAWADNYKFVVRQNRLEYQTVYSSIFYRDGIFRWVKLDGESKDKVKEGDTLIVKQDLGGAVDTLVRLKVLEVKLQEEDFVPLDNGTALAGLYMKIKPDLNVLQVEYNDEDFQIYQGHTHYVNPVRTFTNPVFQGGLSAGSSVRIKITFTLRGSGGYFVQYDRNFIVNADYPSVKDWFEAEVQDLGSFGVDFTWNGVNNIGGNIGPYPGNFSSTNEGTGWGFNNDGDRFFVVPHRRGYGSKNVTSTVSFEIRTSQGTLVFETEPKLETADIFYETPETYLVSQNIDEHILTRTYNCFSFGNGVESNRFKDRFVATPFSIDFFPTSIIEDEYRKVNRFADLTWSGVYQESTNVNKLNEFNLSLSNFKDDLEKGYGSIVRLDSDQTDLFVIQEDRTSKVLFGKDLLFNADGTTNLTRIESVLGQQVMYAGDYGISKHPESYASYGTNSYWTDVDRGVVLRMNDTNGLFEISNQGMNDYFKTFFRDNKIENIIGCYDSFYNIYILNIKTDSQFVTWYYDTQMNGFATRADFNPDAMVSFNNRLFTFKGNGIYEHNLGGYNNFYGVSFPSEFTFNFSQEPSIRKIFKTISIEGNRPLDIQVQTDLQNGFISNNHFNKKEGVFFSHIRGTGAVDLQNSSIVGLGNLVGVAGNAIQLQSINPQISIGDLVFNENQQVVGQIIDIQGENLIMSSTNNLAPNSFLFGVKNTIAETSGLTGYYMKTKCLYIGNEFLEVFTVNTDIAKSFE